MRFDDCLALYPHQLEQKVPLQNMISYEAALRSNVNVGEKVLVPLKDDGRYGPGTVVEDIGLNKTEEGENENFHLLLPRISYSIRDVELWCFCSLLPTKKLRLIRKYLMLPSMHLYSKINKRFKIYPTNNFL